MGLLALQKMQLDAQKEAKNEFFVASILFLRLFIFDSLPNCHELVIAQLGRAKDCNALKQVILRSPVRPRVARIIFWFELRYYTDGIPMSRFYTPPVPGTSFHAPKFCCPRLWLSTEAKRGRACNVNTRARLGERAKCPEKMKKQDPPLSPPIGRPLPLPSSQRPITTVLHRRLVSPAYRPPACCHMHVSPSG